jgi:peptide/nickel transport system ATP-binding protein
MPPARFGFQRRRLAGHLSDRVLIMYLGRIVEAPPAEEVLAHPNHSCLQALLAGVPRIQARTGMVIAAGIADPFRPPCRPAVPSRGIEVPVLRGTALGRRSACRLNGA